MGTAVLLQHLEAAGQPVPPTALFFQDNLAIMVMEGLLNQIKLMRKQCISALEQIDRAAKHKLSSPKGVSVVPPLLVLPVWPTAMSTGQLAVVATAAHELKVLPVPVENILLDQQDEEIDEVPWLKNDLGLMDHFDPIIPSAGKKVGPLSPGLAGLTHALNALGSLKNHWGCKPPILIDNLELIDFPVNIPEQAETAQLLFMKEVVFQALPAQLTVVKLTTDSCTLVQYDGLVATMAVDKGKQ
ncbi:hypothetical protein C0992_008536 [Termitomyces sp. T32_za158]|nr:hypothetical protein C0992_008536 [Termitomyces sp. T32_za158]